jgi:transposase
LNVGITHEQVISLRSTVKENGTGVQGHSRSPVENARAILLIHELMQQLNLSFDAAVKLTAKGELTSPSTLRSASVTFTSTGVLPVPKTSHRGSGNPNHPRHSHAEPDLDLEITIHRIMFEEVDNKAKHVAIKHIQQHLLEEHQTLVHEKMLRRWMHELGYVWDDKKFIGALTPQYRDARIRSFIWEYANALRLQVAGTHIIIYLDESYIHALHQMKKGWHPTSGPYKNNETQGDADTGKRLIIIHGMSRDGMLEIEDAIGSNFLHEITPTAQFVFEAASFDDSDYHNTIDGEAFTLWVKNRLLPAFHTIYPGKKMMIVMDNASYHKPRDFDWITPYKMCKTACITFLKEHGVEEFTAVRDGVEITFQQEQFNKRASKQNSAPTVKELQQAVKSHLKQHPEINKTKIDKLLLPHDHSIVWTPPFVPEAQPIELVWAHVKQLVASQYTLNRSIETTRQQTDDAFDTITAAMLQKRIAHCHKWIDAFMQTDEAGSLKTFGSLNQLVATDSSTAKPDDIEITLIEEPDDDENHAEESE